MEILHQDKRGERWIGMVVKPLEFLAKGRIGAFSRAELLARNDRLASP